MIGPNEVAAAAARKEKENYAFRTYLKIHASPEKLDRQFHRLHKELFAQCDCNACRNCCKEFRGGLDESDLPACAEKLSMTPEAFKAQFLQQGESGTYETIHMPCDFLQDDGSCLLGELIPENCVDYPFTAKPDRIGSLYGIIENAAVCPVVYEILEALKKEYRFVYRRSRY